MATLEMVRLRSMYPNSGRMTVRYAVPRIVTGAVDDPAPVDIDAALREALNDTDNETITTSQVDEPAPAGAVVETVAGKGGSPR